MMRSTETNMRLSRSAAAVRLFVSFVIIVSMSLNNVTLASPYGAYDLFMEDLLLERSKNGDAIPPETQPVEEQTVIHLLKLMLLLSNLNPTRLQPKKR